MHGVRQSSVVSFWLVEAHGKAGELRRCVQPIAVSPDGQRLPAIESLAESLFRKAPGQLILEPEAREHLLAHIIEPMLQREVKQRGLLPENGGFTAELIGWVETAAGS